MAKRQNNKRFEITCRKADQFLDALNKPVEKLVKIIVQLSLIASIIFFILSPSIDKTLIIVPFLLNLGLQFWNK